MAQRVWTTSTLWSLSRQTGWPRFAHLMAVIMVVGFATFATFQGSAQANEPAAVSADPDGEVVAGYPTDGPEEATPAPGYVVDDFEAVDADPDSDPDPDEEGGCPFDFVASRQTTPRHSSSSAPTISGPVAAEVSPTAVLIAVRPARGPPAR